MQKCIRIFAIFAIALALLVCAPLPASAETTTDFSYESAAEQLREAMVLRQSPVQVQVYCDTETSVSGNLFYAAVAHNGTPDEGDYLLQHVKNVKPKTETAPYGDGFLHTITYEITYRTDLAKEMAVTAQVKKILDTLDVYDASDYEKIAAIYNYLCANVSLDSVGHLTGATDIYTAYGALVEKVAVCQGFASAFYRLALELDVDNRFISGKVGTVLHGWNIVALEGVYYNVDATKDAGFSFASYRHFMKKELPTHTRDSAYDTAQFHRQYPMATKDHTHTHYWNEGKITLETNGYRQGEKTFTCTICNASRVEYIPKNGWALINGKWYCYKEGVLETGWKFDNVWYYLDSNGIMQTGWVRIDGLWYYLDSNGVMQTGWKMLGNVWYYLDSNGVMQTGWKKLDNVWYYLDSSGAMQTGWKKLSGVWYYMNASGAMQTGWKKLGGVWYYLDGNGAMATGWRMIGGVWYYFHSSGAMATGTVKIGTITYKFHSSGAWIS